MSHHLKRPLLSSETVHHKDGNRQNNDISNLELKGSNHGMGQDIEHLVSWAVDLLRRYAPSKLA